MENALISVIIPVYNAEKYLDQCVESIVSQTYENLEILLVDDGSTDSSSCICDNWAMRDSRIKVIHKANGGVSSARNCGLDAARGAYIGFVDSDDYVCENIFEELLALREKGAGAIYSCTFLRVNNSMVRRHDSDDTVCYLDEVSALNSFFCEKKISSAVWDKLFACELFDNIRFPEGETNEEYPLLIPLIIKSKGIVYTGKNLYYYRETEDSITSSTWKTNADVVLKHLCEMEEQINMYGLEKCKPSFKLFCAKSAYYTALHLDKNYDRINAQAKENLKKYIHIMRKYYCRMIVSDNKIKDKILYSLIVTRTLRPIYKAMGRL